MKAYTNKIDKIDKRKCLYSEIKGNDKPRKKACRRNAKTEIKNNLISK
jgi:hypothetical protein